LRRPGGERKFAGGKRGRPRDQALALLPDMTFGDWMDGSMDVICNLGGSMNVPLSLSCLSWLKLLELGKAPSFESKSLR
jgi:hypothetical protein